MCLKPSRDVGGRGITLAPSDMHYGVILHSTTMIWRGDIPRSARSFDSVCQDGCGCTYRDDDQDPRLFKRHLYSSNRNASHICRQSRVISRAERLIAREERRMLFSWPLNLTKCASFIRRVRFKSASAPGLKKIFVRLSRDTGGSACRRSTREFP